jgi:succinylarginine dihydrolase
MRNGGGPACLRLRVALTGDEAAAMHQGVIMTEQLYATLVPGSRSITATTSSPNDLADPQLAIEVQVALSELAGLLGMPDLYEW